MKVFPQLLIVCFFLSSTVCLAQQEDPILEFNFSRLDNSMQSNNTERPKQQTTSSETPIRPGGGGAESDSIITLSWPNKTNLRKKDIVIHWENPKFENYAITIAENTPIPSAPVYTAFVKGHKATLPLASLDLDREKEYYFEIRNHRKIVSKRAVFKIVDDSFYKKVLMTVKNDPSYASSSGLKKNLMKIIGLQINNLNHDAHMLFQTYMESDEDDRILRNMRDKFRSRLGIN